MAQNLTFLLVDDDADDIFLFREVLSGVAPEINLRTASNGQEALEVLSREINHLPDLIFLDLNMPRMDGKQCLTELKNIDRLKGIPVIIYTTSSHSRDVEETMQLGAISFITKPSHIKDLKAILTTLSANAQDGLGTALRTLSDTQATLIVC